MRNLKTLALLTVFTLSGAASAAGSATTAVTLTNTGADSISVSTGTLASGGGNTISWATPADGNFARKITASVDVNGFSQGVNTLTLALSGKTGSGALTLPAGSFVFDKSVVGSLSQDIVNGIAAYSSGSAGATYTVGADGTGFTSSTITVTYTLTADGI